MANAHIRQALWSKIAISLSITTAKIIALVAWQKCTWKLLWGKIAQQHNHIEWQQMYRNCTQPQITKLWTGWQLQRANENSKSSKELTEVHMVAFVMEINLSYSQPGWVGEGFVVEQLDTNVHLMMSVMMIWCPNWYGRQLFKHVGYKYSI